MRLRSQFAGYVIATVVGAGAAMAQAESGSAPHAGTDFGKPITTLMQKCHHGIPYDFKLDPLRGLATKDFKGCKDDSGLPQRTFNCQQLDNEISNLERDIQHLKEELETTPPGDRVDAFGMGAITTVPREDAEEMLRAFEQNKTNALIALGKMQSAEGNPYGCPAVS